MTQISKPIKLAYMYFLKQKMYHSGDMELFELETYVVRVARKLAERYGERGEPREQRQVRVLVEIIKKNSWQAAAYL